MAQDQHDYSACPDCDAVKIHSLLFLIRLLVVVDMNRRLFATRGDLKSNALLIAILSGRRIVACELSSLAEAQIPALSNEADNSQSGQLWTQVSDTAQCFRSQSIQVRLCIPSNPAFLHQRGQTWSWKLLTRLTFSGWQFGNMAESAPECL